MKTIGTVINTIVVIFGMLLSFVGGMLAGYYLAKDEYDKKPRVNYGYDKYKYCGPKKFDKEEPNEDI